VPELLLQFCSIQLQSTKILIFVWEITGTIRHQPQAPTNCRSPQ